MEKEYPIPEAQEILQGIKILCSINSEISKDNERSDNLMGNVESYLTMISSLVSRCDESDDEPLSYNADKIIDKVKEEE